MGAGTVQLSLSLILCNFNEFKELIAICKNNSHISDYLLVLFIVYCNDIVQYDDDKTKTRFIWLKSISFSL